MNSRGMRGGRGARGGRGRGSRGAGGFSSYRASGFEAAAPHPHYPPYDAYEDDYEYGYAGKRPIDDRDPMGVKRQRTSSVHMMNRMIQDSQRELANLTFGSRETPKWRPNSDTQQLNQVLNRQQMLLEMQSEMIAGMGGRPQKPDPLDDAYYGRRPATADPFARSSGYGPPRGRGARRGAAQYGYPEIETPMPYNHNPYLDYEYDDGGLGPAPEYYVSIEGKINNFIEVLLEYDDLFIAVQAIETSRHNNTTLVKIRTEYNVFEDMDKDPYIDGHLKINGVLLAREQGYTKHQVKDSVYAKALYMLLTKSVSHIFANSNKLYKDLPEEQKKIKEPKDGKKSRDHKFILARLIEMMTQLRQNIPQSRGYKENLIHELDVACGTVDAGITLVYYKNSEESQTCELYVDDLMLGQGEESDKRGAMKNAYRNAKRLLMNWNYPVERIVRENKRLQNVDILDQEVVDMQYKSKNHERGSNMNVMKTTNLENFAKDVTTKRDIVVYEHTEETKTAPWKVIEDTACANRMLFEYVLYNPREGGPTRCLLFLQEELIADAMGFNRIKSKANAAQKGLQWLKANCPLIKTSSRDYNNPFMSFETAKQKALLLKADNPELARNWDLSSYPAPAADDPKPDDLTPWVDQVLENVLEDYQKTESLEEIILDKDFPKYHITRLRQISKKYGTLIIIKLGSEKQMRTNCVVIQKDIFRTANPIEVVNLLRKCGNESGRYKLIQYKDENEDIVKA
ncbi:hypothetical protein LOTGIDRAFT_229968 [Lottia gigantea]|uniref:DRBM domain-containing protein n=1 Tax=Lottia gigantea TaxID=225164 RepID=V4B3G5_LOTGI|nr:hypothetical protein LOTGIDRAFT_229968 [Lottia gigantea]ESP04883.1 hypothetical protein LOTGIDRAFT_229968 [Lottia gigantea]